MTILSAKLAANNFRELKRIAENFYFREWREREKPAPAFDGETVRVTRKGWIYLTGKSATGDVMRRLALLPIAREIIETTKQITDVRSEKKLHRHQGKTLTVETYFWSLIGKTSEGIVKVIVEEMYNDGQPQGKHFLSVFPVG